MKKVLLGAIAISLVACAKKENEKLAVENSTAATAENTIGSNSKEVERTKPNSTYTNASEGWCNGYPANCYIFPDVIITAKLMASIEKLRTSGSIATAETFRSSEFKELAKHLPSEYYQKLTSGLYSIGISAQSKNSVCYIIGPGSEVNSSNFEFAIQGTIRQ